MGNTKIEWTEHNLNPFKGCSKVSMGCRHCYAETMANRLRGMGMNGYSDVIKDGRWSGKINFIESTLLAPLKQKKPTKYFVNSMSDTFHDDVPFEWIDKIFAVAALCPQHTFQILTKRPKRMCEYFEYRRNIEVYNTAAELVDGDFSKFPGDMAKTRSSGGTWWPLHNVWLGTSVENQATADERIPWLMKCPANVRWLSMEPLLGAVNLANMDIEEHPASKCLSGYFINALTGKNHDMGRPCKDINHIDWVVAGGESGTGARPMHPDWVRSIRDQCIEANVPFFFKQWGMFDEHGNKVGKSKSGRLLDGREWNEYPEVNNG